LTSLSADTERIFFSVPQDGRLREASIQVVDDQAKRQCRTW
jgi:hypothetical protein